ncbi:glycosyltransferase [Luedemannella helvata]|uniref:Glycosyltransferase n=1 Tax=Luedemannella helvata TaxID=349315 RepID=A0ABN2KHD6_9ACTN
MPPGRPVVIWRSCLLYGSETFVRDQGAALTRWQPTYVGAVRVASPLAAGTDVIAFPGNRLAFPLLRLTGGSRRLRAVLGDLRPDLVHAHFAGDGWLVSRTAAALRVPLIITAHGRDVTSQARAGGLRGVRYRRNLRAAFGRAALILAVSRPIAERAIELGADPAKVRVHHTGVALPVLAGAPAKEWDVAFVGRFVAKKGLDDLVEALGRLDRPRVVFIGAGPLEPAIRARATELRLDATFLGHQDPATVRRHVAAARVLAAPSKSAPDGDTEGLPTTILEAAALAVPVVSTRHSGIPEAVLHNETGLLGPEGDRATLAANLGRLLADDGLRALLGARAREHVTAHFDIVTQTRALEALYDSVAPAPSARPAGAYKQR